jgi:DNA repair protein RadC
MDRPESSSSGYPTSEEQPRALQVRDMPDGMRPRELLERKGAQALSDDALLAVVLRSGVHGASVIDVARRLMARFKTLHAVAAAPMEELMDEKGVGRVGALSLMAALEIGRRLVEETQPSRRRIRTPTDVIDALRGQVPFLGREVFWILALDAKNGLKGGGPVEVTRGLLDASLVHPREVFQYAIRASACSVVLAHNHPSGDPTPSAEDVRMTRQLVAAGRIVGIAVLDHIVMGGKTETGWSYTSLREQGLLDFDDVRPAPGTARSGDGPHE